VPDENVDDSVHYAPAGYQVDQPGVRERAHGHSQGQVHRSLKYRWFQKKDWQEEIKRKDFRYLTKTYLPRKLKEEDCLD